MKPRTTAARPLQPKISSEPPPLNSAIDLSHATTQCSAIHYEEVIHALVIPRRDGAHHRRMRRNNRHDRWQDLRLSGRHPRLDLESETVLCMIARNSSLVRKVAVARA